MSPGLLIVELARLSGVKASLRLMRFAPLHAFGLDTTNAASNPGIRPGDILGEKGGGTYDKKRDFC